MPYLKLPDGSYYEVAAGTPPSEAFAEASKKYPQAFGIAPNEGFGANLKESFKQVGRDATQGIAAPFLGNDKTRAMVNADQAQAESDNVKSVGWDDVKKGFGEGTGAGITSLGGYVRDSFAKSLPYMAPTIAGARIGATGGAMAGGLPGAVIGGALGGLAAGIPAFAGQNIQERVNNPDYKGDLVTPGVYGTAALQSALDVGGGAMALGKGLVGKIIGQDLSKGVTDIARATLINTAKSRLASGATEIGKHAVKGAAFEIPTEVAQQVLQRAQANEDVLSPEALDQYGGIAVASGFMGAAFGGVGGVHARGKDKATVANAAAEEAKYNAAAKKAETAIAKQTQMVKDAQEQAMLRGGIDSINNVDTYKELMQTSSGVQKIIDNYQDFAGAVPVDQQALHKQSLLKLRETLKRTENGPPAGLTKAELKAYNSRQKELEKAFGSDAQVHMRDPDSTDMSALSPEEQAAFKEPSLMAKPEAGTYTPEVLKKMGVHTKSAEFKNSVGKPIGDATAIEELKNFQNRSGSETTRNNIEQHLGTIAQTKPVAVPDQTTIAAIAEKAKAGTATPVELQQLRDLQEMINGNQNPNTAKANSNQGPNTAGNQSGVGINDVGGVGTASSAGQVDEGTVGSPSGPVGTDVGRTTSQREPLDVSQDNEYTQARQAMLEYVNNPKPATKQDALVYAMMVQNLDKSNGGTKDQGAQASAAKLLSMASEDELIKATKQYEKYRKADAPKTEQQLIIEQDRQDKLDRLAAERQAADLQAQQEEFTGQKYGDKIIAKDAEAVIADQDKAAGVKQRQRQAIDDQTYHDTQSRAQQDQDIRDMMDDGVINDLGDFGDVYNESRDTPPVASTTAREIRAAIGNVINNKYWTSERIHVVNDVAELPAHRRNRVPNGAQAVAFGGNEVWMIANRIRKGNERAVFLHEVGVHLGMQRILGAGRIKNLSTRVEEMALNGTPQEQEIAAKALARADKAGVKSDPEEVIAYFVEEATKLEQKSLPKRIAAWLKEFFNGYKKALSKAYLNPEAMSGEDIVAVAKGAAKIEIKHDKIINERYTAKREERVQQGVNYSKEVTVKDISDLAEEADNEYHTFEQKIPPKFLDRLLFLFGKPPKYKLSDWLLNGFIGTGESWRRKEQAHFGIYGTVNGKELGFVSQQRATGLRNLVSGAMEFGKLGIDSMGVVKVEDSGANAKTLYAAANDIYAAMRADGAPEKGTGGIYDMFYHMAYADRYAKAKENGFADTRDFSAADVEAGRQYQQQYADQWDAWQDIHQEMRVQTMDFMVQSGAFTPEKAKLYLDRVEYIPFSREEQEAMTAQGNNARGLLSGRTEYHIKGDDAQIKDPMVNIISNQEWLMQWGIKNNSANLIANSMTQMYADTDGAMGGKWTKDTRPTDNKVKIFVNGEAKYLSINDPIDMAIFEGHPTLGMSSMAIFHGLTGLLRKGVTLMPSFHFRQLIEDPLRATIISGNTPGYGKTALAAWKQFGGNIDMPFTGNSRETAAANKLRHLGIVGQRDYQDTHENFLKELSGESIPKWQKALEYTESIAQANDLSTRSAVYEQAYKEAVAEGLDDNAAQNKASYKALMLINFNNRGNFAVVSALMNMVPFINARIQGDSRMYQALIGKRVVGLSREQASKMVIMRLTNLAAFTMLYALSRSGDDDYESAEQNTRDGNFLFNVGGLPMKFPVPPELGMVKTLTEQGVRIAMGSENTDTRKELQAVATAFTTLVFGPSDFTPTIFKPLIENATNHSFFTGRDLVGQYQQGLQTNQQKNSQTSSMAIAISDMLQNGPEMLQVSPIKIDNLIRGWLGTAGSAVTSASDILFGDKPTQTANQIPGVGGMFYNPEGGGLKNDFYEMLDESAKAKQTLTALQKNDTPEAVREFIAENKLLLQMYPKLNSVKAQLDMQRAQYNRALQAIKMGNKSADEVADLKSKIHENENMILKGMPKLRAQMGY